jgi:hypothetical protein
MMLNFSFLFVEILLEGWSFAQVGLMKGFLLKVREINRDGQCRMKSYAFAFAVSTLASSYLEPLPQCGTLYIPHP